MLRCDMADEPQAPEDHVDPFVHMLRDEEVKREMASQVRATPETPPEPTPAVTRSLPPEVLALLGQGPKAPTPSLAGDASRGLSAATIREIEAETAERQARDRAKHRAIILAALEAGDVPQDGAARAAIRSFIRPALFVQDDAFSDLPSKTWRERLASARAGILAALPSVGRIDLTNGGRWVGSGWLVAEDIVATCQHVALEFAYGTAPYPFRGDPGCAFDSLYEHERAHQRAVAVRRVEWMAPSVPGALDVAFLRVEGLVGAPIEMRSDAARADETIAAIGYPGQDSFRNDNAEMMAIFAGVFGVKRLCPGKVITSGSATLSHDCSTLGGSSGSVLLDLASGKALGLHFGGMYRVANDAVQAYRVAELLLRHVTRQGAP